MRALTGEPLTPTLVSGRAAPGHRFLLCSDGLSDVVTEDRIADVLRAGTVDQWADQLVEPALHNGETAKGTENPSWHLRGVHTGARAAAPFSADTTTVWFISGRCRGSIFVDPSVIRDGHAAWVRNRFSL
ncbi:PP2C family protein-serine/threonine phosphatase [Nocardia sp. NPDC058176]|uniref:PP2C family protein-serine/threonine phosphatase n=1 Tax=Nocardia sp. NPDC058176 TaxID=3346368 RepID=UPI0036D98A7B